MLKFDLALAPFFAIAVANFLFSWLWYSPLLFAKPWAKALGIKMDRKMTEAEKKKMPLLFTGAIASSFALSFALQVLVRSVGAAEFGQGACLGGVCWLGFALTGSLGTLWEGRKAMVLLVNNGLFLLTYAVFGGILAIWH
jgi:hypothetical protein